MRTWLVALVVVVGCSPAGHRRYRMAVAAVTSALYVCDFNQTRVALASDQVDEANPLLGKNPSTALLAAFGLVMIAGVLGLSQVPADRDETGGLDLLLDGAQTSWMAVEGMAVLNNASLSSRGSTCGL